MNTNNHRAPLKKGIDAEEERGKRAQMSISLRKSKREDEFQKRRRFTAMDTLNNNNNNLADDSSEIRDGALYTTIPDDVIRSLNNNQSIQDVLQAAVYIRKMLECKINPPIQLVIDSGIVPRLVECLSCTASPELQVEAAWSLTNISAGNSIQTEYVAKQANALNYLVQLLSSPHPSVQDQACWVIANIAGDGVPMRNLILQHNNPLPSLRNMMQNSQITDTLLQTGSWALCNVVKGRPSLDPDTLVQLLPLIEHYLLSSRDEELLDNFSWSLTHLSDDVDREHGFPKIQILLGRRDLVARIVDLLDHEHIGIRGASVLTLGHLCFGTNEQTSTLLQCNPRMLGRLAYVLEHSSVVEQRQNIAWMLGNIAAGTPDQIKALIDSQIVGVFCRILDPTAGDVAKVQIESAFGLAHIVQSATDAQLNQLLGTQQVIPCLCGSLGQTEVLLLRQALNAIERILQLGRVYQAMSMNLTNAFAEEIELSNGLTLLRELKQHYDQQIMQKADLLVDTYYEQDDENDNVPIHCMPDDDDDGQEQYSNDYNLGAYNQFNFGSHLTNNSNSNNSNPLTSNFVTSSCMND